MKKIIGLVYIIFYNIHISAQTFITPFEASNGLQTATYAQTINFYKKLDEQFSSIKMLTMGATDAGLPLHLILFSPNNNFDIKSWKSKGVIMLINNGIHPGEPDGIDASMQLLRDLAMQKINAVPNVLVAVIPIYNIGGALNRNRLSRVNQDGPESYGFRGNSQYLDLNRDFTKCDSKEAKAFTEIFHELEPDIFIDNHVSDGADYQHTMTMLTTQHNKLGAETGKFLHDIFEPALYKAMAKYNWPMCPYVNFESGSPEQGWEGFYDGPRYSSGYAALFGTIGFVPETHMLKPFKQRVNATYAFMQIAIREASNFAKQIRQKKNEWRHTMQSQTLFPLSFTIDSTRFDSIMFSGYKTGLKKSEVTGMSRMYYDHNKPFDSKVRFYNYYKGTKMIEAPKAYIIPQGWHAVIDILRSNKVVMKQLSADTLIDVEAYTITEYKSALRPYEKHHYNYDVVTKPTRQSIRLLKGDFIVSTNQPAKRYLIEMLEPTGGDSFFTWNFFDAILQQKEGYSDYRWEDVAAAFIQQHPEVKVALEKKKAGDSLFASSSSAQLNFIYKLSPYYEPAHLRYPVYRLVR